MLWTVYDRSEEIELAEKLFMSLQKINTYINQKVYEKYWLLSLKQYPSPECIYFSTLINRLTLFFPFSL